MLKYALIRAYFIWKAEMADSLGTPEYEAISLELLDMKERINQLATAIGQDVRLLKDRTLNDLTLTGLAADYAAEPIAATDTGLAALGKLQKQILAVEGEIPTVDYNQVRNVTLTGLSYDDEGRIIATDTVVQAFGKLQGQFDQIKMSGIGVVNMFKDTFSPDANTRIKLLHGAGEVLSGFTAAPADGYDRYNLTNVAAARTISWTDSSMSTIESGETYTWSCRARGDLTNLKFKILYDTNDGNGWKLAAEQDLNFVSGWMLTQSFTFYVPAGSTQVNLILETSSTTANQYIDLQHGSVKLEKGAIRTGWLPSEEELLAKPAEVNIDYSQALDEFLTGYTVAASVDVVRANDNTLTAFGKVQKSLDTLFARGLPEDTILTNFVAATSIDNVNNTDSILTALQKLQYSAVDAYWKAVYVEDAYTTASVHEIWWDDLANDRTWQGIHFAPEEWRTSPDRGFPTIDAGILYVYKHDDYPLLYQEYKTYNLQTWIRSFDGTNWTAWKQTVA